MAYKVKVAAPCRDCGQPTRNRLRGKRIPVCHECGIQRMLDAAEQQRDRVGPAHDAWSAAMSRWVATLPTPPVSLRAVTDSDTAAEG